MQDATGKEGRKLNHVTGLSWEGRSGQPVMTEKAPRCQVITRPCCPGLITGHSQDQVMGVVLGDMEIELSILGGVDDTGQIFITLTITKCGTEAEVTVEEEEVTMPTKSAEVEVEGVEEAVVAGAEVEEMVAEEGVEMMISAQISSKFLACSNAYELPIVMSTS